MKILSICGSPRRGNSEAIILKLQETLQKNGIKNEVILLRSKKINRCLGCVEYCNHKLKCHIEDDMLEIMKKMEEVDGYIFVTPNWFRMPPGIFMDFIDRCSVFYTAGKEEQFKNKKAVVICVGTDSLKNIDVCAKNIVDNFCKTIGMQVVARKTFRSHSELKGNYNDIFENNLNLNIKKDLNSLISKLL